jgi:hypothetical protein
MKRKIKNPAKFGVLLFFLFVPVPVPECSDFSTKSKKEIRIGHRHAHGHGHEKGRLRFVGQNKMHCLFGVLEKLDRGAWGKVDPKLF